MEHSRDGGSKHEAEQTVRIYIVRHGKAVEEPSPCAEFPRPEGFPRDWDRPLTSRGEAQARYLAEQLRGLERRIKRVFSSPYPRAIQTARTIAPAIGSEVQIETVLEVDRPVSGALRLIESHAERRAIMLVGHNPQLGELISVLVSGLPAEEHVLKTGELVAIDTRAHGPIGSGRIVQRLRLGESTSDAHAQKHPRLAG